MVTAHRMAIEWLWRDRCTVYRHEAVTDPESMLTGFREVAILEGQPCKLSFETLTPSTGDPAAAVSQSVKLFLTPDVSVPAGCKVVVTRRDRTFVYSSSGEPGIFSDHQEIPLVLWEGWA